MTTATHTLTLSQTSTPFPFSTLAAASFLNAQPSSTTEAQSAPTVEIVWEKDAKSVKLDGKDVSEEAALDVFSKELKGKEVRLNQLANRGGKEGEGDNDGSLLGSCFSSCSISDVSSLSC
jgi:hypothetical protein